MEEERNQNQGNQPNWSNIPDHYKSKIDEIKDEVFINIYSKFSFKYYKFNESKNIKNDDENFVLFAFDYLIKYKFIIFHSIDEKNNQNDNSELKIPSKTNCVICIEDECLIIEDIKKTLLDEILLKLKEKEISLINVSKNKNQKFTPIETDAKEEIQNFCEHFQKIIKLNLFISYTIDSIIGYLIRRFYFQSSYYNNSKFFYFD